MKIRYIAVGLAVVILGCAIAGAEAVFRSENIFPLQGKHVHGSSIVQCPNGDFLACWFQGSGERSADDVKVNGARLKKGGREWSPIFEMADTPGFPDCNPVLFIDSKDKLWMFWIAVLAHRWECCMLKYRTATEYQHAGPPRWAWQEVMQLEPGEAFAKTLKDKFDELKVDEGMWAEYAPPYTRLLLEAAKDPYKRQTGWMTRIHPLVLPTGRILLPLYSDGFNACLTAISDDGGKNWRASLPMVGLAPEQPTLVRKKDGTIVAYLRDAGTKARVLSCTSKDDGESWSVALSTDIPNPGSSLEVIALKSGNWVMIFNDTEEGRHRLAAALSDDEGATWKWKRHLERSDTGEESFAYPSVIQAKDGLIHMTYSYSSKPGNSIRHAAVNEEWIKEAK